MSRCRTVRVRRAVAPTGGMSGGDMLRSVVRAGPEGPGVNPDPRSVVTSGRIDVDGDGDAIGDDVEDGGPLARLLHQTLEDLGRRVTGDREAHGDLLVSVAHVGVEAQDAVEVDVTDHSGAYLVQL